eukprot:Rhum_TRINITY_DN15083_c5_g1::Rhum_TRINITY_DN15083_c5_g1_i1::g.136407::m.136407
MPFSVCVASDIFGQKVNLELDFNYAPSVPELTSKSEQAFASEMASRKPGNHIFQVSKFHVVDPITDDWVEVIGAHQLRNQCQVYAFQPHSTKYTESQGHIPPASKPRGVYATSAMGGYHSPASARAGPDYSSAGYGTAYPAAATTTTTTTTPAFPQATQVAGVPH